MDSDNNRDSEEEALNELDEESSDDVYIKGQRYASGGRGSKGRPTVGDCWT